MIRTMSNIVQSVPAAISAGTTILYPTETVYGLGCRFDDAAALKALYELKGRSSKIPVALIASESSWVVENFKIPPAASALMEAHWPGPLAMLLEPHNPDAFSEVIYEGFVGIRVSGSRISRELAAACGGAVVSTSANLSGEPTPLHWQNCPDTVLSSVGLIIDGGELAQALPSTLIRFDEEAGVTVLRQGSVVLA